MMWNKKSKEKEYIVEWDDHYYYYWKRYVKNKFYHDQGYRFIFSYFILFFNYKMMNFFIVIKKILYIDILQNKIEGKIL